MAHILAGRFDTQPEADKALEALRAAGFEGQNVTSFYLNPAGAHDQYPLGGDAYNDEGTKESGKSAVAGATVGGITGLALGTAAAVAADPGFAAIAAVAGAGVGAYVGSLAGGLSGTKDGDIDNATKAEPVDRKAGVMVAVRTDQDGAYDKVLDVLRAQGATDIERANGEWVDGSWVDFNPTVKPQLVDER